MWVQEEHPLSLCRCVSLRPCPKMCPGWPTQRILEIVGNIRKQKEEITKVHHCGCGREWVTQADMPKGRMCVEGDTGTSPMEAQSYLAILGTSTAPQSIPATLSCLDVTA